MKNIKWIVYTDITKGVETFKIEVMTFKRLEQLKRCKKDVLIFDKIENAELEKQNRTLRVKQDNKKGVSKLKNKVKKGLLVCSLSIGLLFTNSYNNSIDVLATPEIENNQAVYDLKVKESMDNYTNTYEIARIDDNVAYGKGINGVGSMVFFGKTIQKHNIKKGDIVQVLFDNDENSFSYERSKDSIINISEKMGRKEARRIANDKDNFITDYYYITDIEYNEGEKIFVGWTLDNKHIIGISENELTNDLVIGNMVKTTSHHEDLGHFYIEVFNNMIELGGGKLD